MWKFIFILAIFIMVAPVAFALTKFVSPSATGSGHFQHHLGPILLMSSSKDSLEVNGPSGTFQYLLFSAHTEHSLIESKRKKDCSVKHVYTDRTLYGNTNPIQVSSTFTLLNLDLTSDLITQTEHTDLGDFTTATSPIQEHKDLGSSTFSSTPTGLSFTHFTPIKKKIVSFTYDCQKLGKKNHAFKHVVERSDTLTCKSETIHYYGTYADYHPSARGHTVSTAFPTTPSRSSRTLSLGPLNSQIDAAVDFDIDCVGESSESTAMISNKGKAYVGVSPTHSFILTVFAILAIVSLVIFSWKSYKKN